jgi:hypothetical protein
VGNAALARALAERAADRAADTVAPGARPADAAAGGVPPPPSARIALGGGQPLTPSTRAALEPSLGPLGDVRVHRGAAAARGAQALDALAFTAGRDIAFAEGRYAPETASGRWLLAHEAAHVAQQRGGPARVQRQPYGRGFDDPMARFGVGDTLADFDQPGDASDPLSQIDVNEPIAVDAPSLLDPNDPRTRRARERQQETVILHSQAIHRWSIIGYVVPIARVSANPPAHSARPGTPAPHPPPVAGPPAGDPLAQHPSFPPDSIAYTPDGRALRVAASSPDFIVTWEINNYAVGAGSAMLVETTGGFFMVDAGANINLSKVESAANAGKLVSGAVVRRIVTELGGEPIRAVFQTHPHYDHRSLLEALRSEVMIETIAVNPALRDTPQHTKLIEEVLTGQDENVERQRRDMLIDTDARADFERRLRAGEASDRALSADLIQQAWEQHVDQRVRALPRTRETLTIPSEGGVLDTILTRPLERGGTGPLERSTLDVAGARVRAISDPAVGTVERPTGKAVDRFSTSYLVEMPGGTRLIVLSDLRYDDMVNLEQTFMDAMRELGVEGAKFQIWSVGHHLQPGWAGPRPGEKTPAKDVAGLHTTRASNFRQLLQMLHNARARGPGGTRGSDVVSVSVNPSLVDVGTVELLRSLGFHLYPAGTPGDVQIYEIMTATNESVTGVAGGPGLLPDVPATLERAHRARDSFTAEAELNRLRARELPEGDPERKPLLDEAEKRESQRTELEVLEQRYREAVEVTRHKQTLADAPVAEAQTARLAREAIDRFCAEHNIPPVEVSSVQLTDAALLLIRRPPGDAPAAGTPEGARRARAQAAADLRATIEARHRALNGATAPNPTEVGALYSDLRQYETQLDAIIAETPPGSSQTILIAERTRVSVMHRSMLVETSGESVPSRLPTGELVETKVTAVRTPTAEPSRLAKGMVQTLEFTGRVMGAAMAISSVTGEADLIERYQQGTATTGQLVAGTAERVTSGVVGLQMLRGAKVGPTAFVLISLLQIGEAALGHYDDSRDRNIAMASAAIHGAVSLGCMVLGEVLIATMNPIGILAGAAIMFLGPMLLEVFGLSDWLERRLGFLPADVTGLHQDLRNLLNEYRIIVGSVSLAMRDATGMSEIRSTNPEALRERARSQVLERRGRAQFMEPYVLDAFSTAYETARTSYAGIQELDSWRREFLDLQQEAWEGLPELVPPTAGTFPFMTPPSRPEDAGVPLPAGTEDYSAGTSDVGAPTSGGGGTLDVFPYADVSGTVADTDTAPEPDYRTQAERRRDVALARFKAIESTMYSPMSASEVAAMDQWSEIRERCDDVIGALPASYQPGDWSDVRSKQRELRLMLDNARYRLNPQSFGDYRVAPLLAAGSEGRREYERLLHEAENRIQNTMEHVGRAPLQGGLYNEYDYVYQGVERVAQTEEWGDLASDRVVEIARTAFTNYELVHRDTPHPPARFLEHNAIYRDFAVAQTEYLQYIRDNDDYENALTRLEAVESSADVAIGTAERVARADAAADTGTVGLVDAVSGGVTPLTGAQEALQTVETLRRQFDALHDNRRKREGLLFTSEIQAMADEHRELAVRSYATALGATGSSQPITYDEEQALRTGDLGLEGFRVLQNVGAIHNRLHLISDLRLPDETGWIRGIERLDAGPSETPATVKLVGIVERGYTMEYLWGLVSTYHRPRVIALNANAEEVLGDASIQEVSRDRLSAANVHDLGIEVLVPETL